MKSYSKKQTTSSLLIGEVLCCFTNFLTQTTLEMYNTVTIGRVFILCRGPRPYTCEEITKTSRSTNIYHAPLRVHKFDKSLMLFGVKYKFNTFFDFQEVGSRELQSQSFEATSGRLLKQEAGGYTMYLYNLLYKLCDLFLLQ